MACPPMPFCLSISTLHVCQKANSSVHRQVKSRTGSYRSPPLLHPHALCLGAFQSSRLLGLKSKFKGRGLTLQAAVPALPNIGHSFEEQIALFCGHEDCWAGESTLSAPLPDALSRTFPERFPTMTAARKACRKKLVYIDGGSGWQQGLCGSPVSLGTKIIVFPRDAASALRGEARESTRLMVVYEDDHMAVVVKPPGYAVHGRGRKTVKHILGGSLKETSELEGALPRPHPVHRLDSLTGGLLVCAKTMAAAVNLSQAFAHRTVEKKYHALVAGELRGEGVLDGPVDGKAALTKYRAARHSRSLRFGGHITEVELLPHTGRKHQLRVHMAELGHPIIGDGLYGDQSNPEIRLQHQGLFLWATSLSLPHPVTGQAMSFEMDLPSKFEKFATGQHQRWIKLGQESK